MRLVVNRDATGIRPWLESKPAFSVTLYQDTWPSWKVGGLFTDGNLRTPRRHGGAFPFGYPGTDTTPIKPNDLSTPTTGWAAPPPPSADDAATLYEWASLSEIPGVIDFVISYDYSSYSGYENVTATPSPALVYQFANIAAVASHVTLGRPVWPQTLTGSAFGAGNSFLAPQRLPLIKGGGGAAQRQSAQGAYIVERGGGVMSDEHAIWSWSGSVWTRVKAPYELASILYMGNGWLYTVLIEPETGTITNITPLRECRFVDFPYGPATVAITWPGSANLRKFHALVARDTQFPGSTLFRARAIWRMARTPRFYSAELNGWEVSGTVGPGDPIPNPYGGAGMTRQVSWVEESADIEATIYGTPTGAWNILADGPQNASTTLGLWADLTVAGTEPPEGSEIVVIVVAWKPGTPPIGGVTTDPPQWVWARAELWPEAAVLPFPVSLAGGGLLPGG